MGLLIPIIFLVAGAAITMIAMRHRAQKNKMEHEEKMQAIEKGVLLPQPKEEPVKEKNPYFWGFVLIALGLAIAIGNVVEGNSEWVWGGLFFFVGIAILTANIMNKRERHRQQIYQSEKSRQQSEMESGPNP